MRILLDADDFNTLVRGGVVTAGETEVALADIGFMGMLSMIKAATQEGPQPLCVHGHLQVECNTCMHQEFERGFAGK